MSQEDQIVRGGGPEPTNYDRARHERMRLKPLFHQRFFPSSPLSPKQCSVCGNEITGHLVNINGIFFHYGCYGR